MIAYIRRCVLTNEALNAYTCADVIKDWFEVQIDAWVDTPAVRRQHNATTLVVFYNLIQSTYRVILGTCGNGVSTLVLAL